MIYLLLDMLPIRPWCSKVKSKHHPIVRVDLNPGLCLLFSLPVDSMVEVLTLPKDRRRSSEANRIAEPSESRFPREVNDQIGSSGGTRKVWTYS